MSNFGRDGGVCWWKLGDDMRHGRATANMISKNRVNNSIVIDRHRGHSLSSVLMLSRRRRSRATRRCGRQCRTSLRASSSIQRTKESIASAKDSTPCCSSPGWSSTSPSDRVIWCRSADSSIRRDTASERHEVSLNYITMVASFMVLVVRHIAAN